MNPLKHWMSMYPDKFAEEDRIFSGIHRGDRIFIGTACAEPQYLVQAFINYIERNPNQIFDAEIFNVWTLGVAPYNDAKFKNNFRQNSFFISASTREAVNEGLADYTPTFLSEIPELFRKRAIPLDVALVQTTPPDRHGFMSFGVSVDIVKAAVDAATVVIVQVNPAMPRTHGDGYIHISQVDYVIIREEPILTYLDDADDDIAHKIGSYVSKLVEDGDTIQVGYGALPNEILRNLKDKKHLGIHTELISDGLVELIQAGAVDNSMKTINKGKSVATFCMGTKSVYDFVHDNPSVQFRTIDYTNDPLIIAQHDNMVAINSALEIDLTGQATAESLGKKFYSSVGGQADFMRGAMLARNGKTILTIQSTADNGNISRVVPYLKEGASVTLHRGDVHYVITEYGIAYLHGKNIRERAMELISVAHPKFRPELIKQAKALNLIYSDQAFIPGKKGEYPEALETYRTTDQGLEILLRPVKMSDEPLVKEFFYDLSDKSMYRRFLSVRKDMPHERLQEFVIINYMKEMVIVATVGSEGKEKIVGISQYGINEGTHTAEAAFVVRDDYHGKGVGHELLKYLTYLAKKNGLLGFTAEVLVENTPMLRLFEKMGFNIEKRSSSGVYEMKMLFREA
jgi:acyl-CoA hydrolase/N-acetylglutamate synthase-like GNAT family acetyltransferase